MTEQLHQISIPGLPDGWRAVAYREPINNVDMILDAGEVILCSFFPEGQEYLIVEKIQPRRKVLEYTGEVRQPSPGEFFMLDGKLRQKTNQVPLVCEVEIWREVE